jgi:4-hydroxy-tetrahydrodipicolinate synthase
MAPQLTGLWPPVSTPFDETGAVDPHRLTTHAKALLAEGASGLAILGTTSEANSLTLGERRGVIDACLAAGIPASALLPGTGASAVEDAAELSRHAATTGAAGVLLLPPFYYKAVTDDGLFAFVARLIERCGASVPRIVLYHIPPVAVVGWSTPLTRRLIEAFPGVVVGMKDSSGDLAHVKEVIDAFPNFAVFPGSEMLVLEAMRAGAVGCISATANVNARAIASLLAHWRDPDADARQRRVAEARKAVQARGLIPGVKAILAARYNDPAWRALRPPLEALDDAAAAALLADPAIAELLVGETV